MSDLIQKETEKYAHMWAQDSYRVNSPGENIIPEVYKLLPRADNDTFTDYGAGEGRVIDWIKSRGHHIHGYDLVSIHPDVTVACLWEMERRKTSDWGLCFDVMEHIPPQHVREVLEVMRDRSKKGVAMTVATIACTQGKRHGLTLHETIREPEWWDAMIEDVFGSFTRHDTDRPWRYLYICP